jgi:hypothetical protein
MKSYHGFAQTDGTYCHCAISMTTGIIPARYCAPGENYSKGNTAALKVRPSSIAGQGG